MSLEHLAGLANLISLGVAARRLKVDRLGDTRIAEEMMAAGDAHFKSESLQKVGKVPQNPTKRPAADRAGGPGAFRVCS